MGQRHQIFLKINNPINNKRLFTNKGEKTKALKAFGKGKYTVIALHHQWLYGRAVAVNILNMLLYTNLNTMANYNNPFDKDYYNNNSTLESYKNDVMKLLQIQPNTIHPRGIGFENMLFLNDNEPYMRNNFTNGDNNDGITIIDTLTGKYCMMNIYSYPDDNEINNDVSDLPEMKPVSAREYMRAYYPEKVELLSDYQKEGNIQETLDFMVIENKIENNKINKEIKRKSNGVLTLAELKVIFPEFYKKRKLEQA